MESESGQLVTPAKPWTAVLQPTMVMMVYTNCNTVLTQKCETKANQVQPQLGESTMGSFVVKNRTCNPSMLQEQGARETLTHKSRFSPFGRSFTQQVGHWSFALTHGRVRIDPFALLDLCFLANDNQFVVHQLPDQVNRHVLSPKPHQKFNKVHISFRTPTGKKESRKKEEGGGIRTNQKLV